MSIFVARTLLMRLNRIGLAVAAILVCGCSGAASREVPPLSLAQLGPGAFRLSDLGATASGTRYLASAEAAPPSTCQFEVMIEKIQPMGDAPFSFAAASLVRRPGSDCTTFLGALGKHLGFRGELPVPGPVDSLAASLAILGSNQSRSADKGEVAGSFSSSPAGHWTATKLFLADGEGEVYLHINLREGVGEFSIKDEGYATVVVTELAKILLPKAG
jgi:hypothetical protein